MNILLLGGGGREHALAWKLAQSSLLSEDGDRLFAAPGNPGIAECAECVGLDARDHAAVVGFCQANAIGLVVIGPEAPLVDGLADSLRAASIPVFGPSKAAAQLEGSKGFTKDMCQRGNIPTGAYVRTMSLEQALEALKGFAAPYVLKADGLAAGKGVVIAATEEEAVNALSDMFGGKFGSAGAEVVIEEFLEGEEASFFAISDGKHVVPFGTAQDHKRVGDGDTGPNTGGMGAYSPAAVWTPELQAQVMEQIILPTVRVMADDGIPYSGVLYAGLMLTPTGPQLIEYNCRFGDPECQVLMALLEDDLGEVMLACANQTLGEREVPGFGEAVAMTVVMAAKGYPDTPEKGGAIAGIAEVENDHVKVFHAGTALDDHGGLVANGGRVLNVTAIGDSVSEAQALAYDAGKAIHFPSGFYRSDIGQKQIAREVEREAAQEQA